MAAPTVAPSFSEIQGIFLFLFSLLKIGLMTGLILVPLALIGHENWKRKYPGDRNR